MAIRYNKGSVALFWLLMQAIGMAIQNKRNTLKMLRQAPKSGSLSKERFIYKIAISLVSNVCISFV
jgi:hypothetical protein